MDIRKYLYLGTGVYVYLCMYVNVFDLVGCELVMAGARNTGGRYQLQLM